MPVESTTAKSERSTLLVLTMAGASAGSFQGGQRPRCEHLQLASGVEWPAEKGSGGAEALEQSLRPAVEPW